MQNVTDQSSRYFLHTCHLDLTKKLLHTMGRDISRISERTGVPDHPALHPRLPQTRRLLTKELPATNQNPQLTMGLDSRRSRSGLKSVASNSSLTS